MNNIVKALDLILKINIAIDDMDIEEIKKLQLELKKKIKGVNNEK